ncbi:hypothetical protein V8C86DRAFT_2435793 [Haematococcus lacustris]
MIKTTSKTHQLLAAAMGKRPSKALRAHLKALNSSPQAGHRHCPNGMKAAVGRAHAKVQRLRDVEQSLMGTVNGLQADLDDLQAAHQRLQDEHAALQQVASRTAATNRSLQAARRRLQGQLAGWVVLLPAVLLVVPALLQLVCRVVLLPATLLVVPIT